MMKNSPRDRVANVTGVACALSSSIPIDTSSCYCAVGYVRVRLAPG